MDVIIARGDALSVAFAVPVQIAVPTSFGGQHAVWRVSTDNAGRWMDRISWWSIPGAGSRAGTGFFFRYVAAHAAAATGVGATRV